MGKILLFRALLLRFRKGSSQASPHHTILQPRRGAFGSSDSLELSCLLSPWCPPHSTSRGHSSPRRLWEARSSAPLGRAGSFPVALSSSHKAQCRPWHRQNQAGSGDVFASPFHLMDPSPFFCPRPQARGPTERQSQLFGPGVLECGLFLAAHWAPDSSIRPNRACGQQGSVRSACEVTALPSCF